MDGWTDGWMGGTVGRLVDGDVRAQAGNRLRALLVRARPLTACRYSWHALRLRAARPRLVRGIGMATGERPTLPGSPPAGGASRKRCACRGTA
eukprot:scaffold1553_cov202-Prasinococcus_capsulatus_cf.AAC.2